MSRPRVSLTTLVVGLVGPVLATAGLTACENTQDARPVQSVPGERRLTAAAPVVPNVEPDWDRHVEPFLALHCVPCHEARDPSGGIALDVFADGDDARSSTGVWRLVQREMVSGHMPPKNRPRPAEAEQDLVLRWIERTLSEAVASAEPSDPGRVTLRRLSRTEYRNTVRDLTGVDLDVEALLPADDVGYGFDHIGDVLSLPPPLFEKFLAAAEKVALRAIVADDPDAPRTAKLEVEAMRFNGKGGRRKGMRVFSTSGQSRARVRFRRTGTYRFRLRAAGDQAGADPARAELRFDGKRVATFDVAALPDAAEVYEVELPITAGSVEIGVAFVNDFYVRKTKDRPAQDRNLHADWLEIAGPLFHGADAFPPSHARIITAEPASDDVTAWTDAADVVLRRLASRAYRRPATDDEVSALTAFVHRAREGDETFARGIQLALQAVLVSPHFLFRVESDAGHAEGPHALSPDELATRLSYFLWSSMPDDELFDEAQHGDLEVYLDGHVARMLADPRASALADSFGAQWLQLRRLEEHEPDPDEFPEWTAELGADMRTETLMVVDDVVREDRSVVDLLGGRFTYLNERLAEHYGIDGVTGDRFRRVELADPRRGGVLTHGSILTLTSHPTRTSPVKRGKWVLEQILGDPPAAPPPGLPPLPESDGEHGGQTLRVLMERHRTDPTCATCHAPMDPLGLGLENFNAIGAWRDREAEVPVDASGELPDGRTFAGPAALREILVDDPRFIRCFTEKLLTYALGRGLTASDDVEIERIRLYAEARDYRFSAFVHGIVRSAPFRMRRAEPVEEVR